MNVPFREPLAPLHGAAPLVIDPRVATFAPSTVVPDLAVVNEAIRGAQRGLIVCGPRERNDEFGAWVHALSKRIGFPVIAEAASNARYGFPDAICVIDTLLRKQSFADSMKPDVVLPAPGETIETPQQAP